MIRRVLSRLLRGHRDTSHVSPVNRYIQDGNIIAGENSRIEKLNVHIFGAIKGRVNIEIGKDCMLEGSIVLYTADSKVKIGDRVFLGGGSSLYAYEGITLGDDVMISWNCSVIDTNAHSLISSERANDVLNWKKGWEFKDWSVVESKRILIGSKCWIGFNSIIMKGIELGEGCIVGAGSVVTKNFDSYSIVGGNPAQFIKKTT
jgi:acetyltransferase-like isoleucine patch superfamily enzyme